MRCPGQDTRYWREKDIFEVQCPHCGNTVEFFKDETMRTCRACGNKVPNPRLDFGCALHCKFAEQCLGSLPAEIIQKKQELLKDRVAIESKRFFGKDFKQIAHASKVARYAERIAKGEGGDLAVILCSAYLHDLGAPETSELQGEEKYLAQEMKSKEKAQQILAGLGAPSALMEEILEIIAHHHHPPQNPSINFKCLYDADQLVNLEEHLKEGKYSPDKASVLKEALFTQSGKNLLEEILKTSDKQ